MAKIVGLDLRDFFVEYHVLVELLDLFVGNGADTGRKGQGRTIRR
jgi:hypothetical protein